MTTFSLFVPCSLIALASAPLVLGLVPPNELYGFRTKETLADRDVWFRGNRFAGVMLILAAAFSAVVFWIRPEYASGRDFAGVVVLIAPVAIALIASLSYVRRLARGRDT
jgi:uncharacterized membrane protein